MIRILAAGILALALTGCGKVADSLRPAGQFFELGTPPPTPSSGGTSASTPLASVGPVQAVTQFLELDSARPNGPAPVRTAGGRASSDSMVTDMNQVTEQIRTIYGDASSFVDGFPQAEDTFRNVPTRFRDQIAKLRENKAHAPDEVVQRRIVELAPLAIQAIDHQHERFNTLRSTFDQRLDGIMKKAGAFEQACSKIRANSGSEQAQACDRFLDADSIIKTKAQLVDSGFIHLEDVYKEVKLYQTRLNDETLAGK